NFKQGMNLDQIILNIRSQFSSQPQQRQQLDLAQKLNALHSKTLQKDSQLEARIEAFEMAFKMQTEATDAFDLRKEDADTRALYGNTEMGSKMLIARRLVERGVRFVQVQAGGWDNHNNLDASLTRSATTIDRPAAALLKDLKQRGLLENTL